MSVMDHMMFEAEQLARGWLSVAVASGRDSSAPALCRTVAVESFVEGVRLVDAAAGLSPNPSAKAPENGGWRVSTPAVAQTMDEG